MQELTITLPYVTSKHIHHRQLCQNRSKHNQGLRIWPLVCSLKHIGLGEITKEINVLMEKTKKANKFLLVEVWKRLQEHSGERICKPFKGPKNRFPVWRESTTTQYELPARQAT
jgi:hypothetical protein